MSKLFEINGSGGVVCAKELQNYKAAKEYVEALQDKKAMAPTWKLDIFIDEAAFALVVMNITPSGAFKKGIFEWGVSVMKVFGEGYSTEHIYDLHLAGFPTPEAAFGSIDRISTFIQHRYNLKLEIKKEIRYES